jgi:CO/xanthine dehydrogenase FAD-binding subunit
MRKVFRPQNLEQLWQIKQDHAGAALFAGGTDLLVKIRAGITDPPALITLEGLEELAVIEELSDEIAIGAGVTHSRLLNSPLIQTHYPVLIKSLNLLGSPHIRNMGTLGGNIMTASPAADTLPPLYTLQADIELMKSESRRRLQLSDFITGPGRTRINKGEILSRIIIPKKPLFSRHFFEKVGLRQALSIAIVSMAALYNLAPDNTITDLRLAWGSLGPTIVTRPAIEQFMVGKILNKTLLIEAGNQLRQQIAPINDIRAGADYRRQIAGNLLQRL